MVQALVVSLTTVAVVVVGALGNLLADSTDVSLLREISNLDAPTMLVLFIVLLYKRKLVWGYQLDDAMTEVAEWKAAAQARTHEAEHAATIAEEALRAGIRQDFERRRGR